MSNNAHRMEAIVAVASNGVIGSNQSLPWRLKTDLMRFRRLTMGHALLMGRRTFESIGRPLPGRQSIVLSKDARLTINACHVIRHWKEAFTYLAEHQKLFLVGGGDLYRQLIPQCSVLHVTRVLANVAGDTTFMLPNLDRFKLIESIEMPSDPQNDHPTIYERWESDHSKGPNASIRS